MRAQGQGGAAASAGRMAVSELTELIDHVAHWLPTQGPIKDFIHHNTLHAYQHRPFAEAVRVAARMYGARPYLPLEDYRALHREGRIADWAVAQALASGVARLSEADRLRRELTDHPAPPSGREHAGVARDGLRRRWLDRHGIDMDRAVHPRLFRLIAAYLDQGVAVWRMPHADDTLFSAVRRMVEESWLPYPPYSHAEARRLLALGPEAAILDLLPRVVGGRAHFARYLAELCLAHPGWSGMVRVIETDPATVVTRRRARLVDFIALELIAERVIACGIGADVAELDAGGWLAEATEAPLPIPADGPAPAPTAVERLQELWHEAFERSYVDPLVTAVERKCRDDAARAVDDSAYADGRPEAQVFFCIDDRECSLRRHLEEAYDGVETFGTAGFFGVDCVFQGSDDAYPVKHCPVPVSPRHLIRERPRVGRRPPGRLARALHLEGHANTVVRGWLISQTLGFWAAAKLAFSIFRPSMEPATVSSLRRVDVDADLEVARRGDDAAAPHGYLVGYTVAEMADRVAGLLRSTGASARPMADLVVFLGHGASSVNNPYFSAYDCGACSGKAGAPNARAFARMANDPGVRAELAKRGLAIPAGAWFVGGLHDTTRDEAQFFDLESLPLVLRTRFARLRERLETALRCNARERCRRFALVPIEIDERRAAAEAIRRSTAIFEPRPELNHATNAVCLVGRRRLTHGLFLDRRAFLNSYDPDLDAEGEILAGILNAVVPVTGGISLEYLFSRVDPERYGAGSKLPHNVTGLIGVSNGTEGDLLTGLPTQMTEVHDPVRISVLVEQEPAVALRAARRNPSVYEWVRNGWVRYFALSPSEHRVYEYRSGHMVPAESRATSAPRRVPSSVPAYAGMRDNAPIARIERIEAARTRPEGAKS